VHPGKILEQKEFMTVLDYVQSIVRQRFPPVGRVNVLYTRRAH
jgi:hypothetical protein